MDPTTPKTGALTPPVGREPARDVVDDPFAHHPELRSRIADAETSFFRDFQLETAIDKHPELAALGPWAYSDNDREALRRKALDGHEGDLWIFAYGSLIWDPALRFVEVRRAFLPGYARRLILVDTKGARGSEDAPGLFAALSRGDGCEGVAFRIAEADVDHETDILFRREMVGPGYLARRLALTVGDAPAMALTFLADPECEDVVPDLARADQVDYLACGTGFLGSSYDYLANLVSHLAELGIDDRHCTALLAEVDQHRAALEKHRP